MGLRSWLYGPVMQLGDGIIWLPPLTLNRDDLENFYSKLEEYSPVVTISAHEPAAQNAYPAADIGELLDLPPYNREHF